MINLKYNNVIYIDTSYKSDPGSFARPKAFNDGRYTISQWRFCRELFHKDLYGLKLFFYSHVPGNGYCIAKFMSKIEDILNIKCKSQFGPTQRKTVMWIKPSNWWINRSMKRSLFTLLLRVAENYEPLKDNFEEALFSHRYSLETQYAINRFLEGNTYYTGRKRGWHKQFCDLMKEDVDLLLIKHI